MASKYERARQVARRHRDLGMAPPSWVGHQLEQNAVEGNPQYPSSTCVQSYQYNPETGGLDIVFAGGNAGHYDGVPPQVVEAMARAGSTGRFYNRVIKGRYPYTRS